MDNYKVLIADDEQLARAAIGLQLGNYSDLNVTEAVNGQEAFERIISDKPDIIFLDIQMPGMTGMEVIEKLPQDYQPFIIVVTAYDNYAVKAFENAVVDFLLKPFTDERFDKAFNRALSRCRAGKGSLLPDNQLRDILLKLGRGTVNTMTVKDGAKIHVLELHEIVYMEAGGDYVVVVTKDTEYLHKQTLLNIESTLPPELFIRIHKSTIVNISYIKLLESHFNGDYSVILKNGKKLRLSRNYREQLIKALG